jgi:hypothetical protein
VAANGGAATGADSLAELFEGAAGCCCAVAAIVNAPRKTPASKMLRGARELIVI